MRKRKTRRASRAFVGCPAKSLLTLARNCASTAPQLRLFALIVLILAVMPPLSGALAEILAAARVSLSPGLLNQLPPEDPLAVAEAVAGASEHEHSGDGRDATPAEAAVLATAAANHLRTVLPSYARDQAPTPFLVAAGDPKCPPKVRDRLRARSALINEATERNRAFILELVDILERPGFANAVQASPEFFPMSRYIPTSAAASCKPGSYDSIETLYGHVSRDWSTEHAFTGAPSYDIMLRMLEKHVPKGGRVLVPGAGLGRLAFEVAKRGYRVEANDASPVMAAIAHLFLSHIRQPRPCHPFLHRWKNLIHGDESDQTTMLETPTVPPGVEATALRSQGAEIHPINLTLGDFGKLYGAAPNDSRLRAVNGGFDAVITSFFIDKSNSDTFQALLEVALPVKPGGVLINAGPLAWKGDAKVMLTLDEVLAFWEDHPKTKMQLLEQDMIPIDYSRREGVLLYGERYITPIMALRKTAGEDGNRL